MLLVREHLITSWISSKVFARRCSLEGIWRMIAVQEVEGSMPTSLVPHMDWTQHGLNYSVAIKALQMDE